MKRLSINFTDFWPGFIKEDNYLYNLLSKEYRLEISDKPDILFYSCYGESYLQYKCLRVFYTAENMRPDFSACDFALTFDYLDDQRHFRLPLYAFYIDQKDEWQNLLQLKSREEATAIWQQKKKFCCIVVSNGLSKKRIQFFQTLSSYKNVDSGGRYLNNIGGPVDDKIAFIKDYKFVIAFENSSYPGYTTEKILDPLIVDSIPIYWGNPLVGNDFNKECFLDYSDFNSPEALIEKMLEIDSNPELAIDFLVQPKFPNNKIPSYIDKNNLLKFLRNVIDNREEFSPVAKNHNKVFHLVRRKKNILLHYWQTIFRKTFR